jgi:hypothetical protein
VPVKLKGCFTEYTRPQRAEAVPRGINQLILEMSHELIRGKFSRFSIWCSDTQPPDFRAAVWKLVIHMPVIAFLRLAMREARRPAASLLYTCDEKAFGQHGSRLVCQQFTSISNLSAIYAPINSMWCTTRRTSF